MSMVVIGTVFVDIKGYPYEKYIPTGRNAGAVNIVHGGVGRNIAENIANVGLQPIFVSTVDETGAGLDVIENLERRKVNSSYLRQVPDGMGTWLVIFDNEGDVAGSISKRFSTEGIYQILVEKGEEIFSQADCILVEIDMDQALISLVYQLSEKHNIPVYAVVANMNLALERRDYLFASDCFVCNQLEAGILFEEDYEGYSAENMLDIIRDKVRIHELSSMVITLGENGAVYASKDGLAGHCPALNVKVKDTAGAGDAFFSGICIGLNYGKTLEEACQIGSRLAASTIELAGNSCPNFHPEELGISLQKEQKQAV